MSIVTLCFDCHTPLTIPEALKSVMWQDTEGSVYLNVYYSERTNCSEYSRVYECLENMTVEEMLRSIIVTDDCGHCAINLLANICAVCEEPEQIQ